VPDTTQPPPGYDIHAEIKLEVPVEHGLLIENLLDLAHAPFTHQRCGLRAPTRLA
jgi:phenylpropionate dioxygenase-like ring-hydroxylating dioxygenase large terminal subunit